MNKIWNKLFWTMVVTLCILTLIMILLEPTFVKWSPYYQNIWPNFIGTCFGVVFSAGFAGAFMLVQERLRVKSEGKVRLNNLHNQALSEFKSWEGEINKFLLKYDLEKNPIDIRPLVMNLVVAKETLIWMTTYATGLRTKIKDIQGVNLMSSFDELVGNIGNLMMYVSGPGLGYNELIKLVDNIL